MISKILLTKSFQATQSGHQLSVYENKIFVQNCFQNGKVVTSFTNGPLIVTISTKAMKQSQGAATNLVIWWDEKAKKKVVHTLPTQYPALLTCDAHIKPALQCTME